MMSKRSVSVLIGTIAIAGSYVTEAQAFDLFRRHGRSQVQECYQKVVKSAEYTWISRQVMMQPGWSEIVTRPATYATKSERVTIAPARTVWHMVPAEYRTVTQTLVIRPAATTWVAKRSWRGEVMCKVVMPAEVAEVQHQVLVSPAKKLAEKVPAIYGVRDTLVMVGSAHTHKIWHDPVYGTVRERVLVNPAATAWVRLGPGC